MEDTQRIVKCGNLSLHSPGGFFKKRWHPKYLVLYDGSKSGVKRLELFESEIKFKKQIPERIIPLVDCVRVVTCQRQKTTYTFEVRTSDQFYLLAGQSFQDMTDWVNCLRLVAFGQSQQQQQQQSTTTTTGGSCQQLVAAASAALAKRHLTTSNNHHQTAGRQQQQQQQQQQQFDVLLETRRMQQQQVSATSRGGSTDLAGEQVAGSGRPASNQQQAAIMTASQAAAAAATALAKTRQRQPSLLGSCKPQPPTDSPFIQQQQQQPLEAANSSEGLGAGSPLGAVLNSIGSMDTLTPTVRGQLISATSTTTTSTDHKAATQTPAINNQLHQRPSAAAPAAVSASRLSARQQLKIQAALDEEEENMLYCSIEDNPSEHNYRVKVIETELSLRCQLKCYQLTAPTLISEQYEELSQFRQHAGNSNNHTLKSSNQQQPPPPPQIVTFYQLIVGPQELTLLNDYAAASSHLSAASKQQGLWSWPYQCIRRYGFDKDNCFMFEAGRKCTSGPGQFIVQTPKAYIIYQDVVKFVNELRTVSGTGTGTGTATSTSAGPNQPADSLTTSRAAPEQNGATSGGRLAQEPKEKPVVTQIPVTWTPSERQQHQIMPEINPNADSLESRRQFFDALRQSVDTSSVPPVAGQQEQQMVKENHHHHQQQQQQQDDHRQSHSRESPSSPSASSSASDSSSTSSAVKGLESPTGATTGKGSNSGALSTDETDESGYDQGDDSVESGSRSCKQSPTTSLIAASRKRQANDSMSSASSTSSAGSPGQSISRSARANVKVAAKIGASNGHNNNNNNNNSNSNINGQGPAKRPPIVRSEATSTPTPTTQSNPRQRNQPPVSDSKQQAQLGLHHLITDEVLGGGGGGRQATPNVPNFDMSPREFEANLIRDVYSEITKLHAKFAVASSGSADDSLSSHSSQVESASSDQQPNRSGEEEEEEDDDHDDFEVDEDDLQRLDDEVGEPTYSNVRLMKPVDGRRNKRKVGRRRGIVAERRDEFEAESRLLAAEYEPGNIQQQNNINRRQQLSTSRPDQHPQHFQQLTAPNSYGNNMNFNDGLDYLSCRPLYNTVLNPIPECGELAHPTVSKAPPLAPKPQRFISNNTNNTNNNHLHHQTHKPTMTQLSSSSEIPTLIERGLPRARLATRSENIERTPLKSSSSSMNQPTTANSRRLSPSSSSSSLFSSSSSSVGQNNRTTNKPTKLKPTNHYVINDVQYAKISRNLHSNFESCL